MGGEVSCKADLLCINPNVVLSQLADHREADTMRPNLLQVLNQGFYVIVTELTIFTDH